MKQILYAIVVLIALVITGLVLITTYVISLFAAVIYAVFSEKTTRKYKNVIVRFNNWVLDHLDWLVEKCYNYTHAKKKTLETEVPPHEQTTQDG